jgi:hypothetical protein
MEIWWRELMKAWAEYTGTDMDDALDFFHEWLTDLENQFS